jgi:hypothetical protein
VGKWINTSGEPGKAWYVDKNVDLDEIGEDIASSRTITLRLVSGGTLVIRSDHTAVLAYGED